MIRLILHMGLHKTGTTAIQAQLASAREQLLDRGIWYPEVWGPDGARFSFHHDIFHALAGKPSRLTEREALECVESWKSPPTDSIHTVILSSESISRHALSSRNRDWRSARRAFLKKLAEVFSEFDVHPLIVLRRQDDFIRSLYQEHVRKGNAAGSRRFQDFRKERRDSSLRFLENIELTEQHLARPTVLIYEDMAATEDLMGPLLFSQRIDTTDIRADHRERVRLSLTPKETLVKLHINQTAGYFESNRKAMEWLDSRAGRSCLNKVKGVTDIWESRAAREDFLYQFADECRTIRERYFPDRSILFPPLETEGDAHYRDELSEGEKRMVERRLRRSQPKRVLIRYWKRFKQRIKQLL